jgi:hypothetical protein
MNYLLSVMIIKCLLFILINAFKKEKDLFKDFLFFNFPLILIGHLSHLLTN